MTSGRGRPAGPDPPDRLVEPARGAPGGRLERAVLGAVFLLPLLFWAPLAQPFSTPKAWLLAVTGAALAGAEIVFALRLRPRPDFTTAWGDQLRWASLAWLAAVGLSAALASFASIEPLALALLPLALFLAVSAGQVDDRRLVRVIAWSSTSLSVIALLQWLGLDPLRALRWNPDLSGASPRMRVYGTLGNPNFVAAWLSATLPLVLPKDVAQGKRRAALVALQLAAIAATGSRVLLLALPAMAAVVALARRPIRWWWWAAAVAAAAAAAWLSPARPLGVTVAGRYYLARTAATHLPGVPMVGYGPGAFEARFGEWRAESLRRPGRAATEARAFAGPVDHAHNDYLEFWIEYGPLGFAAFLGLCAWLMVRAWPPASWTATVSLAGVAGLLAIALVDFPFHRPAEWTLLWMLLACASRPASGRDG